MSRCYICDHSPGNQSIYRLSGTRPSISFDTRRQAWVCSECSSTEDTVKLADLILTDEDLLEPKTPPMEIPNGTTSR